jgi:hypothetical protein
MKNTYWTAFSVYVLLLASSFAPAGAREAPVRPTPPAANWCQEAERNLSDRSGGSVKCGSVEYRCVLLNNYWCIKNDSKRPWKGTTGSDGNDGNRDRDGHAVFISAEWAARAIAFDLRSKYMRGFVSAYAIEWEYAPWCDTVGSHDVVSGHGRTCPDYGAKPPAGFRGPFCLDPEKANAGVEDCRAGCNCPPRAAKSLVDGLGLGIYEDLKLFDARGRPQANLVKVVKNIAKKEQSIYVNDALIEKGISMLKD